MQFVPYDNLCKVKIDTMEHNFGSLVKTIIVIMTNDVYMWQLSFYTGSAWDSNNVPT